MLKVSSQRRYLAKGVSSIGDNWPEEICCLRRYAVLRRYHVELVSSQRRYLAKGVSTKGVSGQRSNPSLSPKYVSLTLVIYAFILFPFNINV